MKNSAKSGEVDHIVSMIDETRISEHFGSPDRPNTRFVNHVVARILQLEEQKLGCGRQPIACALTNVVLRQHPRSPWLCSWLW